MQARRFLACILFAVFLAIVAVSSASSRRSFTWHRLQANTTAPPGSKPPVPPPTVPPRLPTGVPPKAGNQTGQPAQRPPQEERDEEDDDDDDDDDDDGVMSSRGQQQTTRERTQKLVQALNAKEVRQVIPLFGRQSLIVSHTELPTSGVYRGLSGLRNFASKWKRMANLQNVNYVIKLVDEARDTSVIQGSFSGEFKRNGRKFENLTSLSFILWKNGKVAILNCVDEDFNKTLSMFQTRAEALSDKLMKQVMECGDCPEVQQMIADDAVIAMPNVYPVELISVLKNLGGGRESQAESSEDQSQKKGNSTQVPADTTNRANITSPAKNETARNETTPDLKQRGNMTQIRGIIGRGREGFSKLTSMVSKLVNHTLAIKTFYGDNDTVVKVCIIAPFPIAEREPIHPNLLVAAHELTALWSIQRFNEEGKLQSVEAFVNRPLPPQILFFLRNELKASSSSSSNSTRQEK